MNPTTDQDGQQAAAVGLPAGGWSKLDNAIRPKLRDMGPFACAVYLALKTYSNRDGVCYHASARRLRRDTGLALSTVVKALSALQALGLLAVEHTAGQPNRYTLTSLSGVMPGETPTSKGDTPDSTGVPCGGTGGFHGTVHGVPPGGTHTRRNTRRKGPDGNQTRAQAPEVLIPTSLDTPEFREVWEKWIAYRRKRRASLLPECLTGQLEFLSALGTKAAIASILSTIRNGWIGLFEPKEGKHNEWKLPGHGPGQQHDPLHPCTAL